MVSLADYKYLSGPDITGAYAQGAKFVDQAETAELDRQLAREEDRRNEERLRINQATLAIRQANEARAARAAQLAEQQRREQAAAHAAWMRDVERGLQGLTSAARPGQIPPRVGLGVGVQPRPAPAVPPTPASAVPPTPASPVGFAPPGGGSYAGAPPLPPTPALPSLVAPAFPGGGSYAGAPPLPPTPALPSLVAPPGGGAYADVQFPPPTPTLPSLLAHSYAGAPPLGQTSTASAGVQPGGAPAAPPTPTLPVGFAPPGGGSYAGAPPLPPTPALPSLVAPPGGGSYAGVRGSVETVPDVVTQRPLGTLGGLAAKYPEFTKAPRVAQTYISQYLKPVPDVAPASAPVATVRSSKQARESALTGNIRTIRSALFDAARTVPLNAMTSKRFERKYNAAQLEEIRGGLAKITAARQWYATAKARKIFETNPELFEQAGRDPIAFYEQYKDVRPPAAGRPTAAAQPTPTAPVPPEVAAVDSRDARVIQGMISPPGGLQTISDVVNSVAKPKDPGKIRPPNVLAYSADPPKAAREIRQAEALMQVLAATVRYHAGMAKYNPNSVAATLDHLERFQKTVAHRNMLRGSQAIALFAAGDPRLAEQLLSERRGVTVQLIPDLTTAGVYNRYENGQLVRDNIPESTLLESLRRDLEAGYAERMIKDAEAQREVAKEIVLKLIEERGKVTPAMLRRAGIQKIDSDGQNAVLTVTQPDGSTRLEIIPLVPPEKSTDPAKALASGRRTINLSSGVPIDPNAE